MSETRQPPTKPHPPASAVPAPVPTGEHEKAPQEMSGKYLVQLSHELYARTGRYPNSRELHERAFQIKDEVERRVLLADQLPAGVAAASRAAVEEAHKAWVSSLNETCTTAVQVEITPGEEIPESFAQGMRECQAMELADKFAQLQADRDKLAGELAELRKHQRWNIEKTESGLRICEGEHERAHDCQFVEYVPQATATRRADLAKELADALRVADDCLHALGKIYPTTVHEIYGDAEHLTDAALTRYNEAMKEGKTS